MSRLPVSLGKFLKLPSSWFLFPGQKSSSCLIEFLRTNDQEKQDLWVGMNPVLFLLGCPAVPADSRKAFSCFTIEHLLGLELALWSLFSYGPLERNLERVRAGL